MVERGFVLQFRACSAKGGKPWARSSRRRGSHAVQPGRSPSASTHDENPKAQAWRLPPNREAGSAAARERGPLTPTGPHRPSALSPRFAELAASVPPLPHIIRVPPGELADILVHVLEALFGLFQLLLQSSHGDRHLLSAAGFATALQAAYSPAAQRTPPDAEGLTARPSQWPQALFLRPWELNLKPHTLSNLSTTKLYSQSINSLPTFIPMPYLWPTA